MASFAATSRRCHAVCRLAPLRLRVHTQPAATTQEEQATARHALQALIAAWPGALLSQLSALVSHNYSGYRHAASYMETSSPAPLSVFAGVAELDLRGSPLEDGDLLSAARMPALAVLQLSGCKKLTPAGCSAVLYAGSRLRTITLQRCFQLTAGALSDVLGAAAAPGAHLAAAALSHLSLAEWPAHGAPPAGRLRALALHNCAKLGPAALGAIAASCPRLEVLLLGGCSLVVEEPAASPGGSSAQADGAGGTESSAASADGGSACGEHDGLDATLFAEVARNAVLSSMPVADGGGCGSYAAYLARLAAALAAAVVRLPQLEVLELTFGLPGLAPAMQRLLASEVGVGGLERAAAMQLLSLHCWRCWALNWRPAFARPPCSRCCWLAGLRLCRSGTCAPRPRWARRWSGSAA